MMNASILSNLKIEIQQTQWGLLHIWAKILNFTMIVVWEQNFTSIECLHMEYISPRWYDISDLFYHDFVLIKGLLLTRKLLNDNFKVVKLKTFARHHELFNCYGISVSQMATGNIPIFIIKIPPFFHRMRPIE